MKDVLPQRQEPRVPCRVASCGFMGGTARRDHILLTVTANCRTARGRRRTRPAPEGAVFANPEFSKSQIQALGPLRFWLRRKIFPQIKELFKSKIMQTSIFQSDAPAAGLLGMFPAEGGGSRPADSHHQRAGPSGKWRFAAGLRVFSKQTCTWPEQAECRSRPSWLRARPASGAHLMRQVCRGTTWASRCALLLHSVD